MINKYLIKLYTLDNKFIRNADSVPPHFTGISVSYHGTKIFYKNGWYHKEEGPAVSHRDGTRGYYFNNKLHNLNGAAITFSNGSQQWWIDDKQVTQLEHKLLHDLLKLKRLLVNNLK